MPPFISNYRKKILSTCQAEDIYSCHTNHNAQRLAHCFVLQIRHKTNRFDKAICQIDKKISAACHTAPF